MILLKTALVGFFRGKKRSRSQVLVDSGRSRMEEMSKFAREELKRR